MPYEQQKLVGKRWEWGYPTFYNAHAFQHHVNKDPARAFGTVEYVLWDPHMKRVLLVIGLDRARARQMGAHGVVDRIENGEFPDVSMGCFQSGALVTMGDGTRRPIEDVQVGDEVITHLGRKRKVTKTHRRKYKGDLYSIKAEAHRVIRCTRQHPFLAVGRDDTKYKDSHSNWKWRESLAAEPDWVHAECLSDQMLVEPVLEGLEDVQLVGDRPTSKGRALARLLGYYLADGHLLRSKAGQLAGIELTVNKTNPIHEEIEQLCGDYGTKNRPNTFPRKNSDQAVGISIFDERLAESMLTWGGVYSKKRLAPEAMRWAPSLLLELLGAYANSDGCSSNGALKFSTASEDLAWQVSALLPRLGILPSVSLIRHKAGSGFNNEDTYEWVVHVGKQWAPILAPYCQKLQVQEVFKTKNSRMIYGDLIATPIREIESMYVETDVYNLEVEEDESYLVEGLAVHNCRVPYDVCSICADWDRITKNPKQDLAEHRRSPIRGLSTVTSEYCQHLQNELNQIYPDGRKVKMLNIHPRFFDLSLVFIGADKTSKVLAKLAHKQCPIRLNSPMCKQGCTKCSPAHAIPSSHVYDVWDREKVAMQLTPFEEFVVQHNREDRDAGEIGDISSSEMGRLKREWEEAGGSEKTAERAGRSGAVAVTTNRKGLTEVQKRRLRRRVETAPWHGIRAVVRKEKSASSLAEARDHRVFLSQDDQKVLQHLKRKDVTPGFLVDVSQWKSPAVRRAVLNHPNVPKMTAERLQSDQLLKQAFGYDDLDDYIPDQEHDQVSSYFQRRRSQPLTKRSEIAKRVRSHFSGKALPALQATEPDLPTDIQDRMSDRLPDSLSSCGGMGIVVKPREFQRMYIRSIGRPGLADDLDSKKIRFRMGHPPSDDFGLPNRIIPSLIKTLLPMLGARSAFGPPLHRRVVIVIHKKPPIEEEDHECMDHPLLDKISSAYSSYRRDLMYKTASLVRTAMHENPDIVLALYGCGLDRALHGGLAKVGSDVVESMLGTLPATYLNRAYYVGPVSGYVEEHSDLTGLVTAGELASVGGVT
jgi:intein/homing endonuclease